MVVAEVGAEREDLAPAGRAAGVDGGRRERDEAIPVRRRVGALVPHGRRQHAAEGPPRARPAGVLVGEGDYGESEAGIRDGVGEVKEEVGGGWQAPAAVCVGTAEELREVHEEEDEKESEREEEEEPREAEVVKVTGGAARPGPHGHRRERRRLAVAYRGAVVRWSRRRRSDFLFPPKWSETNQTLAYPLFWATEDSPCLLNKRTSRFLENNFFKKIN